MSKKQNDILNRVKGKKTGAKTFIQSMNGQPKEEEEVQALTDNDPRQKEELKKEETQQSVEEVQKESTEQKVEMKKMITKVDKLNNPFINALLESESQRTRMEDTHKRVTFLIQNELADKFDQVVEKSNAKGAKTKLINSMIEDFLDSLEAQGFKFK